MNLTLPRGLMVPLMVLAGALVAFQSRVNGALAGEIGTGLRAGTLAAVISFGSGLAVMTLIVVTTESGRRSMRRLAHARSSRRLRWYELVGGLGGALFVASQGIAVGTIGVALFIVAFTAGQSLSSLAVDHLGFGPGGVQAVSVGRTVAAACAIVAVLLKAIEQLDAGATWLTVGLAALAFVAGTAQAVQQALNGRVSAVVQSPATTWNNFLVGTTALLVLLAVSFLVDGRVGALPTAGWYYLGGVLGIGFIMIAAVAVQTYGVLVLGLCMIAGQVVTAELLDLLDPVVEVGALGLVGGAVALLGVVVALLLTPPRRAEG
ncbi:DMT family transporter [Aeromicrobium sp. Leaf350]|uniref:DMT family transporter n=1 Tax=Aeromicrobium sp. Leaf350 TaxID=2876565 RepID=UPI001E49B3F9|nr:DMT family transporter [Aeromicrobium sp. Leaf350]